jgi:hypothetical protein
LAAAGVLEEFQRQPNEEQDVSKPSEIRHKREATRGM